MLHNPYFSAGAGLWVLTVGGMMSRASYSTITTLLRRRFLVSMEVTNTDSSFSWLLKWMSLQKSFKVQQMTVLTSLNYSHSNDHTDSKLYFGPCAGVQHYFFHQGRPITLYRLRTDKKDYDGGVFETLKLSTVGLSTKIFEDIMNDAKQLAEAETLNRTVVYVNSGGRWTRQQHPRARRPFDSVVMPGDLAKQLADDVRCFLRSGDYYRNLGVPYRRGYLLHGPPGCGKTSFVMALAGELNLSISLLSLANRSVNDEALMELLNSANQSSIVLIEDIDRAFSSESAVSMSGLLNALDGVGAQEGNVVFMTTNHVERLDAALIRPGRADVKLEIGLLDQAQTRKLFHKFYPDAPRSLQDEFAARVPPHTVSPAQYSVPPLLPTATTPGARCRRSATFSPPPSRLKSRWRPSDALPPRCKSCRGLLSCSGFFYSSFLFSHAFVLSHGCMVLLLFTSLMS
ncbi:mitochondrial chaperone BCS1 [Strigomonas culicis]|uniref:Mitochondrial chaperone BCS1 n=1 Tax=Strigomonas culicis TaxID=28005 RepID=S9W069_9TRYP|nr:mitochondrial chaperone BCS1 [Strigomonas culicis]|eukprot:EPY32826.1 mitochondrial chaperone BCS1 [Strigomonas culicis]